MAADLRKQGLLRKSHKGAPISKGSNERWFVSEGFHVSYYTDRSQKKLTGKFDLRNVVVLRAAREPGVQNGLTFVISDVKTGKPKKTITVSFDAQPAEAAGWAKLWASAVACEVLEGDALKQQRDAYLAHLFDQEFHKQIGLRSTTSTISVASSQALILSPRVVRPY